MAAAAAAAAAAANATAVDRAQSQASKGLSNMYKPMPNLKEVAYYDWLNAIDSAGILYGWHRSIYVHTVASKL